MQRDKNLKLCTLHMVIDILGMLHFAACEGEKRGKSAKGWQLMRTRSSWRDVANQLARP